MEMIKLFTFPDSVSLANRPTRLYRPRRSLADYSGGREILVKRDDETGCGTSGNKIRKLEFYAAEALQQGADTIITAGHRISNHTRTTALVARELGMDLHLILAGEGECRVDGNLFLEMVAGAEIHFVPPQDRSELNIRLAELADDLRAIGRRPYVVPAGGSSPLGVLGYARCAQEIKQQVDEAGLRIDAITVALGSGSTTAGLILGAEMFGLGCPVYGVHVTSKPELYGPLLRNLIEETRDRFHIATEVPDDRIRVITGYVGNGYGQSSTEDLAFIQDIARRTGLLLDPTYTGKAFRGTLHEMRKGVLQNCERVLFIHTGGLFALYNWRSQFQFAEPSELAPRAQASV